jgi:hypothetical protein
MGLMERVANRFRGYEWLGTPGDPQERDLALVELMVLAMHADHREVPKEDATVREFCRTLAWSPPMDAEVAFERATETVVAATARSGGIEELFESICVRLGDAGAQQFALTEVAETMLADGWLDVGEMDFVDRLRQRFGVVQEG